MQRIEVLGVPPEDLLDPLHLLPQRIALQGQALQLLHPVAHHGDVRGVPGRAFADGPLQLLDLPQSLHALGGGGANLVHGGREAVEAALEPRGLAGLSASRALSEPLQLGLASARLLQHLHVAGDDTQELIAQLPDLLLLLLPESEHVGSPTIHADLRAWQPHR